MVGGGGRQAEDEGPVTVVRTVETGTFSNRRVDSDRPVSEERGPVEAGGRTVTMLRSFQYFSRRGLVTCEGVRSTDPVVFC